MWCHLSCTQIKELFSDTKDELDAKVEELEETSTQLHTTKEKLHSTKEVDMGQYIIWYKILVVKVSWIWQFTTTPPRLCFIYLSLFAVQSSQSANCCLPKCFSVFWQQTTKVLCCTVYYIVHLLVLYRSWRRQSKPELKILSCWPSTLRLKRHYMKKPSSWWVQ